MSSTEYPVTVHGWSMTKDRAATGGGEPGHGSGGEKDRCRRWSTAITGSLQTELDKTQLPTLP